MDSSMRYLNPLLTDRVNHLIKITYTPIPDAPKITKNMTYNDYKTNLEIFETNLLKNLGFNFIIKNVPNFAIDSETRKEVKVTYAALRNTFNQFGNVLKIDVFMGNVYLKFKTQAQCDETHKQLDNMKIGNNIIKTKVI
jgi:hypothetical protein